MAYRVVPDRQGVINIGKIKENLVTEVELPAPGFGGGSYAVLLRRPKEEQPYPVAARHEGGSLVWTVQTADTAIAGTGKLECRWYGDNGEVAKSQTYMVRIADGLPDPTEAPEAWEGFMGQVARDAQAAQTAAGEAKANADGAAASAGIAQGAATKAGKLAGAAGEAANAAAAAASAASSAQAGAESAERNAQAAAGTPVQVAYKLAEPVPFQATGNGPIMPLEGETNTIMTDADSVTVTGRADPIRIIQQLQAAQSAAAAQLDETQAAMLDTTAMAVDYIYEQDSKIFGGEDDDNETDTAATDVP